MRSIGRIIPVAVATLAIALVAVGCGGSDEEASSGGGGASEGLPATVKLTTLRNLTGAVAPYGKRTLEGNQFAVDEINRSGFLGDTKLELEVVDVATDVQQAVNEMSQAARSDAAVVFSPVFSTQVQSMAPIAQRSEVPFVVIQAGVPGIVEAGDFVYRITPPQESFIELTPQCLAARGTKSTAMIYQAANATIQSLAQDTLPQMLEASGIQLMANEGYPDGTRDFSAVVSKVLDGNPDAVGVLPSGPDVSAIITQLSRQGFQGQIFGQAGMGADSLEPVSEQAESAIWATDFSAEEKEPQSTVEFIESWREEKGSDPDNFNAEAYDAVWLAARALKEAGSVEPEAVKQGMATVAQAGFDGALGSIRFEDRDARVEGVVLEWKSGNTALAGAPCGA